MNAVHLDLQMPGISVSNSIRRRFEDRLFGKMYVLKSALFYNLKGWDAGR